MGCGCDALSVMFRAQTSYRKQITMTLTYRQQNIDLLRGWFTCIVMCV